MDNSYHPIQWPEGKQFAFTIFDDPDGQSLETSALVYSFLKDLGFRTTKSLWSIGAKREPNSGGETCANRQYLTHASRLAEDGFELAWHNATLHTSTRQETALGLEQFRSNFGRYPISMANHYNGEAVYWGPARVTGSRRAAYLLLTRCKSANQHFGHVEGHPYFWGDLCKEKIRYCRNFVFASLNTLAACPWMPYHDQDRPWVNRWFASTEGANCHAYSRAICEINQDRLEAEGGACILYTHFGHGFVSEGKLNGTFVRLMKRLSQKSGWFVPAHVILDHLAATQGVCELNAGIRRTLEWRWLREKTLRGTS